MFGFLKKMFSSKTSINNDLLKIKIQCDHCQDIVNLMINKIYDVRQNEDGTGYILTKEVQDSTCFKIMHLTTNFDKTKKIIDIKVTDGKILSIEE